MGSFETALQEAAHAYIDEHHDELHSTHNQKAGTY
jgi:hypothetical protein